jgi:hypothetical protein
VSPSVAVLFARTDSIYKTMPACDVYDAERDAMTFPGGLPVVAHPPCRLWGALAAFSKAPAAERELAIWAVEQVRVWGGVLEHPANSRLWGACALPRPGARDEWGGVTLAISQWWWGHRAEKWTWLYLCGIDPREVPELPYKIGEASHVIANSKNRQRARHRLEVTKRERDATPPELAEWLVMTAQLCGQQARAAQ